MGATASRSSLTIPAEYLEDVRVALAGEIRDDADALSTNSGEDRESSLRILSRDARIMEQLIDATEDTTIVTDEDDRSGTLDHLLDAVTRTLSGRLERVCVYSPVPMGDVLDITERLRWASGEAIRLEPGRDHRLSQRELKEAAR